MIYKIEAISEGGDDFMISTINANEEGHTAINKIEATQRDITLVRKKD